MIYITQEYLINRISNVTYPYMNMWNVHMHTGTQNVHNVRNVHIYIEHRNPETQKTLMTSEFRYETLYYLWVKRFFDIRREAQSFYAGFSIYPPHNTCSTRHKASASERASESQPSSSEEKLNSTDFFQIPPNLPRTLPVHDVIHIPKSYLGFFFWHLWMTHPPCAWTPALMLILTNPCAKRKVLSLTKPKGKIYKSKSLGHYITLMLNSNTWNLISVCKWMTKIN